MEYFTLPTKHPNDVEKYSKALMRHEIRYWVNIEQVTSHNKWYVFHLECTRVAYVELLNELGVKVKGVNK